jgi:hypothetical protein
MVYFISLKSLRILEEFRENPHIKIPPKYPCGNSQSLAKFQNPLEFENQFLLESSPRIWPDRPSFPCIDPSILQAVASSADPFGSCAIGVFWRVHFPFGFVLSALVPCLSPLIDTWAPPIKPIPFLPALPELVTPLLAARTPSSEP